MRYEPLAHRVILREIEEQKTTKGGLFIPDIARRIKGVAFGEVIAVGHGRLNAEGHRIPVDVKPGDIVMFPSQAVAVLPLMQDDGSIDEVLMCTETDIIAIVHDLPRHTMIVDRMGAPLSLAPSSLALPDQVYENREGIDRSVSDLRQVHAPPDVIAEVAGENRDQHEAEPDLVEH